MATKTIIQVSVTAQEIESLQIRSDSDVPGNLECVVTYHVLTSGGQRIGLPRGAKIPLTSAQQTTVQNFVLNTVVPAINTQEGT